jgi:hypothetical protein
LFQQLFNSLIYFLCGCYMLAINLYIPCNFTLKKGRKLLYFLCLQNLLVFFFIFSLAVSMSLILEEKTVKSWRIILRKYLKDNICIRLNFFFFSVFSSNILMSLLNYCCWPSLDICEEILESERGEDPRLDICGGNISSNQTHKRRFAVQWMGTFVTILTRTYQSARHCLDL